MVVYLPYLFRVIGGGQIFKGTMRGLEIAAKKVFNRGRTANQPSDLDREVAMLAQLVHPNILFLIGVSDSPDGESIIVRSILVRRFTT